MRKILRAMNAASGRVEALNLYTEACSACRDNLKVVG